MIATDIRGQTMIRLSVTDLDQYLIWRDEMEDVGPEWLIDRLSKFKPSPAMQAGSAFHGALERLTNDANLLVHDLEVKNEDGSTSLFKYKFSVQCDAEISLPSVRELKIEREIFPGVVLVGKIDGADGATITDYKLTERLDAERYADSMQWRSYLMLFEAQTFEYSVFEGSPDRGRTQDYTIHAHHRLRFFAYDGMREDVIKCAGDLAAFVTRYDVKDKIKGDQ